MLFVQGGGCLHEIHRRGLGGSTVAEVDDLADDVGTLVRSRVLQRFLGAPLGCISSVRRLSC